MLLSINQGAIKKYFNRTSSSYCEGCSFLGLKEDGEDQCILCNKNTLDEDQIGELKFGKKVFKKQKYIGYYIETIDGFSKKFHQNGSSGGLMTAILAELLQLKKIDYALVVGFKKEREGFGYVKVEDWRDLSKYQSSVYYPINLDDALEIIRSSTGKCAITCIPSATRAIELLKIESPQIRDKIKYTLGLTYNSTKLKEYTEYLCKKSGKQDGLCGCDYISYRYKHGNNTNKNLGGFIIKSGGKTWSLKNEEKGSDWSIGLLQDFSSNFVDDHFNECADISVMDAWHKNYLQGPWKSLAIIRNVDLKEIIENSKDIIKNNIDSNIILESQQSGINFKNKELGIRLAFYKLFFGNTIPKKRVAPYWGKNPILIIRVILRLYISIKTENIYKKYSSWEKVDKKIRKWQNLHKFIYKIQKKINNYLNK